MNSIDQILRSQRVRFPEGIVPALKVTRGYNPPYNKPAPIKKSKGQKRDQEKSSSTIPNPDRDYSWIA